MTHIHIAHDQDKVIIQKKNAKAVQISITYESIKWYHQKIAYLDKSGPVSRLCVSRVGLNQSERSCNLPLNLQFEFELKIWVLDYLHKVFRGQYNAKNAVNSHGTLERCFIEYHWIPQKISVY